MGLPISTKSGPTKWKKIRVVDFGDTLADILRNAKRNRHKNRFQYGELYQRNFYREVMEKNRVHYEYYHLGMTENVPEDYTEIFFVCLRGGWLSGTSGNHRNSLPDSRKKSTGT